MGPLLLLLTFACECRALKWNIALNLGREPTTSMPKEWGASGARFFLQTEVDFAAPAAETKEPFLGNREALRAEPTPAQYTGLDGSRTVDVGPGAWALALDLDVFRFWLDFSKATGVESRGVELPAEKLYFTATAFDAAAVATRRSDLLPKKQAVFVAEAEVKSYQAGSPTGVWNLAKRVDTLNAARADLERLEKRLPKDRAPIAGSLPGAPGDVLIDSGSVSVRRKPKLPFGRDVYFVVGRFTATPVLEGAELAASKRLYY